MWGYLQRPKSMYYVLKTRLKELDGTISNEEAVFAVSKVRLVSLRWEVERGEKLLDLEEAEVLLETLSRNEALRYADEVAYQLYQGYGGEI